MAQRVRIPYRGQSPSSVTQLPILTALHARRPTLFAIIIQQTFKKVNPFFLIFPKTVICSLTAPYNGLPVGAPACFQRINTRPYALLHTA